MCAMNLKDKVVLISGGAQGIGAAIVQRFADEGAIVAITDLASAPIEAQAQALRDAGKRAVAIPLDVALQADWVRAVDALTQDHGGVDILINNAGILDTAYLEDISDEAWDLTMAVNAKGPFLGCRAVMASMRARGGGAIVNVSSMAGITGGRATHYCSSKGAVRLMTKSVALVGAPDKIRCNSVHPGFVETAMAQMAVAKPGVRAAQLARLPLGRFADPSEIANVVVFLASDEASFMTGAEVAVDGGAVIS